MVFHYSSISLFGFTLYEPVTILTNLFILVACLFAYKNLQAVKSQHAFQWAMFFLLIGISSVVGSFGHGIHMQLGDIFFKAVLFFMNAASFIAIYFCFKAANTHFFKSKNKHAKIIDSLIVLWLIIVLFVSLKLNNFIVVKIHAGAVLLYSIILHYIHLRKSKDGSELVVLGILISFLSIFVHSIKLNIHSDWFNYKDISHLVMMASVIVIYLGANKIVSKSLLAR